MQLRQCWQRPPQQVGFKAFAISWCCADFGDVLILMAAVVSLSDIEIINLERVGFNLKNFDMAIVFKVSCWGATGRWWESSGDHGGGGGGGEQRVQKDWPIDVRWQGAQLP
jgi:hypothetical protein